MHAQNIHRWRESGNAVQLTFIIRALVSKRVGTAFNALAYIVIAHAELLVASFVLLSVLMNSLYWTSRATSPDIISFHIDLSKSVWPTMLTANVGAASQYSSANMMW
jgi:hypothetical protein